MGFLVFGGFFSLDSGVVLFMNIVFCPRGRRIRTFRDPYVSPDKQVSAKPGSPFDPPTCGLRRYKTFPNVNSSGVLTWDDSLGFGGYLWVSGG